MLPLVVIAVVLSAEPTAQQFPTYADVPTAVLAGSTYRLQLLGTTNANVLGTTVSVIDQLMFLEAAVGLVDVLELRLAAGVAVNDPLNRPLLAPAGRAQLLGRLVQFERVPLRLLALAGVTYVHRASDRDRHAVIDVAVTPVLEPGAWTIAAHPWLRVAPSESVEVGGRLLVVRSFEDDRLRLGMHLSASQLSPSTSCTIDRTFGRAEPMRSFRALGGGTLAVPLAAAALLSLSVELDTGYFGSCQQTPSFEVLALDPIVSLSFAATNELLDEL